MEGEFMEKEKRGIVISPESGREIDAIYAGDRVVRKESIDYLKSVEEWKIEHFYKGHIKEIEKWMKDLSIVEKAFLFSIVPYISYNDCHLAYGNGVDIGTEDLVEITGLSRGAVYEAINSLVKKDILYKGRNSKNRQYFVNPWLFAKGSRINKVLKTMFKNYRIRVLGGVRWKDAGQYPKL